MKGQSKGNIILYYIVFVLIYFVIIVPLPFMGSSSGSIGSAIMGGIMMYIFFYSIYLFVFGWFRNKITGKSIWKSSLTGLPITIFFMIFGSATIEFILPLPMNFEAELGLLVGLFNIIPLAMAKQEINN